MCREISSRHGIAGQFAVVSQPQRGTSIQARVPLFKQ